MPTEFTMPKLGLTMEEGTIVEWMVAEGERVRPGTAVVVVETDKVTTEVEVPDGGRLHFVGVVGSTYLCGELIGHPGEQPRGLQQRGHAAEPAEGRVARGEIHDRPNLGFARSLPGQADVRGGETEISHGLLDGEFFGPHRRIGRYPVHHVGRHVNGLAGEAESEHGGPEPALEWGGFGGERRAGPRLGQAGLDHFAYRGIYCWFNCHR